MHEVIRKFVNENCIIRPDASVAVKEFYDRFRNWLPARERKRWQRWRLILELERAGYPVGAGADNVAHVGGLAFKQPRGWVKTPDGRLLLSVTLPTSSPTGWQLPTRS